MMFRNQSVSSSQFSMIPRSDVPRSAFRIEKGYKTTFDAGYLIPVLCEEVLPGDSWRCSMTAFARLATPLFPLMDNLHLDSFFFFVPNRLVWTNWKRFMGEQSNVGDSISYVVPQIVSPVGGFAGRSLFDYFGLPTFGQIGAGATISVNVLPLRAYNLIFNEWFRDENLVLNSPAAAGDGPDTLSWYSLRRRGKRADYFTTCLPWPQKGATPVSIPIGTSAPVRTSSSDTVTGANPGLRMLRHDNGSATDGVLTLGSDSLVYRTSTSGAAATPYVYPSNLYADLSTATAATINQLRQAFQIQRLLERDARGGTRYTEIVKSHFGVMSPDARLQRPEYLGGGSTPIVISPIAQQSGTGASGTTTPLGSLGGVGTSVARNHGFSQSFTEHGYIIGIVCVRADLTYQQGLRKHWSRSTRYDYYFPAFANLGEQAVLSKEIYCDGSASDDDVFGYQERWSEYRYSPSEITGYFRSTTSGTIDPWHLSQRFTSRPVLNATFIEETPPLSRVLAVGAAANGQQLLFDAVFQMTAVRPLPAHSVPGLIDHL